MTDNCEYLEAKENNLPLISKKFAYIKMSDSFKSRFCKLTALKLAWTVTVKILAKHFACNFVSLCHCPYFSKGAGNSLVDVVF